MTSAPDPLEQALADACLEMSAPRTQPHDLRAFLEARGVPSEDIAAIVSAAAPGRILVYRRLVRNALSRVVVRVLARTRARLNAARPQRFDLDLARFLQEVGPRTHHLRDLPAELLTWADRRWRSDPCVPSYLPDLAAYELACFAIASSDAVLPLTASPGEIEAHAALAFAPSVRLFTGEWAVHELDESVDASDLPLARPVRLLGYRDEDHTARWIELGPVAGAVMAHLLAGEPLASAVAKGGVEQGVTPDVLALAHVLADLGSRGVLLGSAPSR